MKGLKLVYTPEYDIRFMGLEKLHPFDSCKYSRAWAELEREYERDLRSLLTRHPPVEITREDLLLVHAESYLESLKQPAVLARALEMPLVAGLPYSLVDRHVLRPMRLAAAGTVAAAREALECGAAVNFSGGYHHARPDQGEGFCLYADAAVAIQRLGRDGLLGREEKVAVIDLDAHQGNGTERAFLDDRSVAFFDMFNRAIYPGDTVALPRIDEAVPLDPDTTGDLYLALLKTRLPGFLDRVGPVRLAVYNAGTDVYHEDLLGGLALEEEEVLERDRFVFAALAEREIPWLMLPSGGYSPASYRLIARSVLALLRS